MVAEILTHEYVPTHEILSKKEAQDLLESLETEKDKLPKILASDPVVKKIKAKPGDILKITRKNSTAGTAAYYRAVV